jgi:hypothetical protein
MVEFIELPEEVDRRTPDSISAIHLVADNVITHRGKLVRAWLAAHRASTCITRPCTARG